MAASAHPLAVGHDDPLTIPAQHFAARPMRWRSIDERYGPERERPFHRGRSASWRPCHPSSGCSPACLRRRHGISLRAPAARSCPRLPFSWYDVALVAAFAFVLGIAGLFQSDRNRLLTALDRTGLAARPAFQFAMLELVHHTPGDALLSGAGKLQYCGSAKSRGPALRRDRYVVFSRGSDETR